ncbi:MAG TPA: glycosyltransferase, partial [Verrucomicrobiae bacterium]|nr:glycosyltransferase [Verrucomicrobiae bacterium]
MKICYLTRDDGTEIRGLKMCSSLVDLGHEVVYVGWDRTPEKRKDLNHRPEVKLRILQLAGEFGKNSWNGWGAYCRHVVRALQEERPDAVQSMNEDTALLALPFKRVFYRYLIEDVHDSVVANRHRSVWLDWAARVCRWLGNAAADRIIETGPELQEMLGRFAWKSVIIENAPYDPGPDLAARVPLTGPIRLHLGGYLSRRRMGLETLLQAVDLLPRGRVTIEASGWLLDDYAKEVFATHPAVNYRWLAKPIDFLACAASCDALLYLRSDA